MADSRGVGADTAALLARVRERLPQAPVIVALSGGADSAVLAWAVSQSTKRVRAVSVDHGLPGSDELMDAATAIAAMIGLRHEIVVAHPSSSSETALRQTRYAALEAATAKNEVILTGHTLDDQAETVLGNVLRGTGAAGLSGIPPTRGRIMRLLLDVARSDTRLLAEELGLPFVDDPQNSDARVRRNRIRNETIPALAHRFNPRLVEALGRLASSAAADDEVLESRAARVPVIHRDGAVAVPAAVLATLPAAIAARVARRALREVRGPYAGTAFEIAAVLDAVNDSAVTIGGAVDIHREGPWVVLVADEPTIPPASEVEVGGEVGFGDWVLSVEAGSRSIGRFSVTIPLPSRLVVRAAMPNERIAIAGGSKRVGDALAEAGVPLRVRPRWPVVEADGTIAWLAGVRAAPSAVEPPLITVRARRTN